MELIFSIAGLLIGITGVGFAIREKFISRELRRAVERIEKWKITQIWTNIGIVATVFDSLDEAKKISHERQDVDQEILRIIESARRGTIDHWRVLLQEAVLAELNFNMETIRRWKLAGKLENEWRVRAAMRLLPTNEIPRDYENLSLFEQDNKNTEERPVDHVDK